MKGHQQLQQRRRRFLLRHLVRAELRQTALRFLLAQPVRLTVQVGQRRLDRAIRFLLD